MTRDEILERVNEIVSEIGTKRFVELWFPNRYIRFVLHIFQTDEELVEGFKDALMVSSDNYLQIAEKILDSIEYNVFQDCFRA